MSAPYLPVLWSSERRRHLRGASVWTALLLALATCGRGSAQETPPAAAAGLDLRPLEELDARIRAGRLGHVDRLLVLRGARVAFDRKYENDYREISRGRTSPIGCGVGSCEGRPFLPDYNYLHPDQHPFHRGREVHSLQSVTKSVVATLVGIAVRRGELSGVNAPLLPFLAGYELNDVDPWLRVATLEDVLTMRLGMEWHETDRPIDSTNTTLRLERSDDWVQFTLDQPMEATPGERWVYNSGASQLLSAVLLEATGRTAAEYAGEHLFEPLGIDDWHWKSTPTGLSDTEGGLYLRPEDLASIGRLYLQDGVWHGRQILPPGWAREATARQVERIGVEDWGYGWQWWRLDWDGVEIAAALGFGDQILLLLPEHDVVAVLAAWNLFSPPAEPPRAAFTEALLQALRSPGHADLSASGTPVWDGYFAGIHLAEVTGTGAARAIRLKEPRKNAWLPAGVPGDEPAVLEEFTAVRTVARLAERLDGLVSAGWAKDRPAVAWPDAETLYLPAETLSVAVDGIARRAIRWAARDASHPVDVVTRPDGEVVAASDLTRDVVLVRRGWEDATTVGRWRRAKISPAAYGYRALPLEMVPMRDGIRLATLVYLPEGESAEGPFPVIFVRTPYGIGDLVDGYWQYAARGYAVVLQAVRGTAYWDPEHRSEGTWGYFRNEAADGADALTWVSAQPWSSGEVCTAGGSYLGYTQWSLTMAGHPALKCLVPEVSMGTMFSDQPYWGGGFVEGLAYYITWMLDKQPIREGLTWTEVLHHRPLLDIARFATGEDIPQWNAMLEQWVNDEYWAPQNWYAADVPREFASFHISGWWDDDLPGTMANWALVREQGDGPRRLLLGPWKHGYNQDRALNGFSFGPEAVRDDVWLQKQLWYDHFLKGMRNGALEPVVEFFLLGENRWRTAAEWPPPGARSTPFYLHSDGNAEGPTTSGSLTREPPAGPEPFDEYVYDPARPVTNWMSFDGMTRWEDQQTWPYDFKDIEGRPDVAVYTSAPLAEDLTIAGDPLLVLHASADVLDTDWWVHVSDVDPDGVSKRLTTGVLRARFRGRDDPRYGALGENYTREELLSGDLADVVEYRIGLRSIANTFPAGHRIRVAVYNALDNYQFPNSNIGGDEARVTRTVPATLRVHHSPGRASRLLLPVLEDAAGGGDGERDGRRRAATVP